MRPVATLRAALVLALALAGACTDDDGAKGIDTGNGSPPPAQVGDADDGSAPPKSASAACVDRPPGDAPRPPATGLPCELISPGFVAPR